MAGHEIEHGPWDAGKASDFAAPPERTSARSLAVLRLLILPIIFAGDQLVAHPKVGTTYFNIIFAAACIYGAFALCSTPSETGRDYRCRRSRPSTSCSYAA